jgi:hypothetical protein
MSSKTENNWLLNAYTNDLKLDIYHYLFFRGEMKGKERKPFNEIISSYIL